MDSNGAPESIELAGVPLGSFPGSTYDELTLDLQPGDLFVFCSDGVFEANDLLLREFGTLRLADVCKYAISYAEEGYPVVPGITATVKLVADLFRQAWPASVADRIGRLA